MYSTCSLLTPLTPLTPTTIVMRFYTTAVAVLGLASAALALPTSKRGVTTLSASQLAGFAPFTQFARATYCSTDKLQNWSCGEACDANPTFQPTLVGGDGNAIQNCECYFVSWAHRHCFIV